MRDLYHPLRVEKGSSDRLREHLGVFAEFLRRLSTRLEQTSQPDQTTVILAQIAMRTAMEAERLSAWVDGPTDQLAWVTRNVYELNLRVRFLLADDANTSRLRGEMVSDQIKLMEALLKLFDHSEQEAKQEVQKQIERFRAALQRDNLPEVKQMLAGPLAAQIGLTNEHEVFYGLYSKYVHPSAFLIMGGQEFFTSFDWYSRSTLLMNAQTYIRDTLERITQKTGISLESLAEA